MATFKYDQTDIHLRYGKSRKLPKTTMTLWMETISKYVSCDSMTTIIDLGCGTGRFTKPLSEHFSAKVYGIDPSWKMLMTAKQAISSPQIEFIQGSAENIPLQNGVADLVFLSMVYHHFQDKSKSVQEIARVLKAEGFLAIRTATVDSLDSYLYLQFFPEARRINLVTLPSREGLTNSLKSHGFELKRHTIVRQLLAENLHKYFKKISLRGLSDLAAIGDDAFYKGLVHLKEYCQEKDTKEAVYEDIDLFIFWVA
jgi:ubiquinone/menaquinone biosynthesis C-methylase UbiE